MKRVNIKYIILLFIIVLVIVFVLFNNKISDNDKMNDIDYIIDSAQNEYMSYEVKLSDDKKQLIFFVKNKMGYYLSDAIIQVGYYDEDDVLLHENDVEIPEFLYDKEYVTNEIIPNDDRIRKITLSLYCDGEAVTYPLEHLEDKVSLKYDSKGDKLEVNFNSDEYVEELEYIILYKKGNNIISSSLYKVSDLENSYTKAFPLSCTACSFEVKVNYAISIIDDYVYSEDSLNDE